MDSEKLKSQYDSNEIKKINNLRLFLYQLRSLINHPEAGEELYSDALFLIEFVEKNVEPILIHFTANYLENAKRWLYLMLKSVCIDFVKTVDARRKNERFVVYEDNLIERLHITHEQYFDIIFDPTFKMQCKENIIDIMKKYCQIMSYIFFDFDKDIKPLSEEKIKNISCYFCQMNASFLGVGRIEGMCEESDEDGLICETYTKFKIDRYKHLCDHYIGNMTKFKTPWDLLLTKHK